MGRELTLKEFRGYLKTLPRQLNAAAVRGIKTGVLRAVPIAQRSGDTAPAASDNGSRGAFDTGAYRQRWKVANLKDGAILYNASAYADVIEKGRRAGRRMPPPKVIERWARRKLKMSAKEAKKAAYPMALMIGRRGLRARFVLRRVDGDIIRVVLEEVKREIGVALRGGQ